MSIGLIFILTWSKKQTIFRWNYDTDNADETDDLAFLKNPPVKAESLLYSLDQAAGGINVNANKTNFTCFKQEDLSNFSGKLLKLVDRSRPSATISTELMSTYSKRRLDRLVIIWKSDLSDKIKQYFFQVRAVVIYGYATWTLTKRIEKKLYGS